VCRCWSSRFVLIFKSIVFRSFLSLSRYFLLLFLPPQYMQLLKLQPTPLSHLQDSRPNFRAMKTLTDDQLASLAGRYFAPQGLYQYTKSLPFLGNLHCTVDSLVAGQWTELVVTYTVGGSGLADGAWIKGTFKFYSVWIFSDRCCSTTKIQLPANF
jgi:hypothetical protein